MSSRIYKVSIKAKEGTKEKLVRAHTRNGAVAFASKKIVEAEVASQDELVRLAASGEKVEDATDAE